MVSAHTVWSGSKEAGNTAPTNTQVYMKLHVWFLVQYAVPAVPVHVLAHDVFVVIPRIQARRKARGKGNEVASGRIGV